MIVIGSILSNKNFILDYVTNGIGFGVVFLI